MATKGCGISGVGLTQWGGGVDEGLWGPVDHFAGGRSSWMSKFADPLENNFLVIVLNFGKWRFSLVIRRMEQLNEYVEIIV